MTTTEQKAYKGAGCICSKGYLQVLSSNNTLHVYSARFSSIYLISKTNAVNFLGVLQQFGAERCRDKLRMLGKLKDHVWKYSNWEKNLGSKYPGKGSDDCD